MGYFLGDGCDKCAQGAIRLRMGLSLIGRNRQGEKKAAADGAQTLGRDYTRESFATVLCSQIMTSRVKPQMKLCFGHHTLIWMAKKTRANINRSE